MSDSGSRFTDAWDAVDPFDPAYPHLWVKVEHLGRYLFASRYLAAGDPGAVLDSGCGCGYGAVELADSCRHVLALDSDADLINSARGLYPHPRVEYQPAALGSGEVSALLHDRAVDGAVCFETLEHLTDPAIAIEELHSVLTPGGVLILSVPNGVNERVNDTGLLSNRLHRRAFSISSISELLTAAGFSVSEVLGQPLTNVINGNETRLIRRGQTDGRIGDEPAVHSATTIRRLALAVGYPEPRDIERSYSIVVVAHRT